MDSLVFSQTALYKLQQLSKAVRDKTGIRHRLSEPKSVMTLLRYSSSSPDRKVFFGFSQFSNELSSEQRAYLQERGILFPAVNYDRPAGMENQRNAV